MPNGANAVGGDDTIYGNAGNDLLLGGAAGDTIYGNTGCDVIIGDNGSLLTVEWATSGLTVATTETTGHECGDWRD